MITPFHSEIQREYEITLAIISEDPEQVRSKIAALNTIGCLHVSASDLLQIRDIYFDTSERDLRKGSWALRLRFAGGTVKFALKGPAIQSEKGLIDRPELEDLWSHQAPERIETVLAAQGIVPACRAVSVSGMSPVEALTQSGFRIIQTRETRRELKGIIGTGAEPRIADLAVDSVSYYFDEIEIRHAEIEIEAKGPDMVAATETASDHLIDAYGTELQNWNYSKLAVGMALEELLKKGDLQGMIRSDRYLRPAAYDRLKDCLNETA